MNLNSFVIDFYVTISNSLPSSTLVIAATVPSSNDLLVSIQSLIDFIKANDINIGNYSAISNEIGKISSKISSNPSLSSKYSYDMKSVENSSTSKDSVLTNLSSLLTKLQGEDSSTEIVTVEEDKSTSVPPSSNGNSRSKRTTGSTSVTSEKTLGSQVSSLQSSDKQSSTNFSTLLTKLKGAMGSLADGTANSSSSSSSSSSQPVLGSINTTLGTNFFNTKGKTTSSSKIPNNLIRNVAERILGNTSSGNMRANSGKTSGKSHSDSFNQLMTYSPPESAVQEPTTSTNVQTADYYEISSVNSNGYISVFYSYYKGGSATSSYAFSFTLSPMSLNSLSLIGFEAVKKMSTQVKNELCQNVGYIASSNPTDSDLWNCYLIWLYSFIGLGVGSQLGFGVVKSFPGQSTGSVNYMMGNRYLESVGNFSLIIQMYNMNSMDKGLTSVSLPSIWPTLMYSYDKINNQNTNEQYKAQSIIEMISTQLSTSV